MTTFVDVAFFLDKRWKEVEDCKGEGSEDHVALGLHLLGPESLGKGQNKPCVSIVLELSQFISPFPGKWTILCFLKLGICGNEDSLVSNSSMDRGFSS